MWQHMEGDENWRYVAAIQGLPAVSKQQGTRKDPSEASGELGTDDTLILDASLQSHETVISVFF